MLVLYTIRYAALRLALGIIGIAFTVIEAPASPLLWLEEKAVTHPVRIRVAPCDHPSWVDACGIGPLKRPCPSTRDVDGGEGTVGSTPKTVEHEVRVKVTAHDHPSRVDIHRCKIPHI